MGRIGTDVHELSVGELAERNGVAVSALHSYESEGLIAARRTAGNQRRFARETSRRVAFIRTSQRVGLPLGRIREALDSLPDNRTPTRRDRARLSDARRVDLDARLAELEALRDRLGGCLGCGCLPVERCRMANPDDVLGELGPGARNWRR
jgi:MerR family redox-sensitive transcriptional activator SoxR